jgi:hypothetical protein
VRDALITEEVETLNAYRLAHGLPRRTPAANGEVTLDDDPIALAYLEV